MARGAVVLGRVPGHVQHGALQEGRPRVPEDLGRAPEARTGAQEAGQSRGHSHQPLRRRQHDVLVGVLVLRGKVLEVDGKTPAVTSEKTAQVLEWYKALYLDAMDSE